MASLPGPSRARSLASCSLVAARWQAFPYKSRNIATIPDRHLEKNTQLLTQAPGDASVAPPTSAHPMPSCQVGEGPGDLDPPHLAETLPQWGKHEVTNKQTIWYQIRIFGDGQHMSDAMSLVPHCW